MSGEELGLNMLIKEDKKRQSVSCSAPRVRLRRESSPLARRRAAQLLRGLRVVDVRGGRRVAEEDTDTVRGI